MAEQYSTYEAKAKFSEILRLVRRGQRVTVTYRGTPVAEIRPVSSEGSSLEERLQELEERGAVSRRAERRGTLAPVATRPGALARFLSERNG